MDDRYAATVGFVVAGVGLAATFLEWAPAPVLVARVASAWALCAVLAFAARRYGAGARWLPVGAAVAGGGLVLTAAAGILGVEGTLPYGPPLALLAGLLAVGAGAADYAGLETGAVRERERRTLLVAATSAAALLFGSLLASVALAFVGENPVATVATRTAVASAGYGLVGVGFVTAFRGRVDLRRPDRRDLLVAGAGVAAIFALHVAMVATVSVFDLPATEHSLIQTARETPAVLLPLIPISFLFVAPGEELLARNAIQQYLYGAYSRHSAVVVACLVFTGSHLLAYAGPGAAPGAVLVTLARLFVVSLVLGVAYERTDNLFAPIVVHGAYDAVQFAFAYVAFT